MKSRFSYPFALALVLCLLFPRPSRGDSAPGTGNNNLTGITGEYNGSITTGGSYDPYTGNAKRFVDDLTVTGSVGAYPLKWTRILNTRGTSGPFGDGGGWSHNYSWGLGIRPMPNPNPSPCAPPEPPAGTVYYPDGREVQFNREVDSSGVETWSQAYGFEPMGDRLVHVSGTDYDLELKDGGRVKFRTVIPGLPRAAKYIVDPYNQVTTLDYISSGGSPPSPRLVKITEPAGRYLQIDYQTFPPITPYPARTVIHHVASYDGQQPIPIETVRYDIVPVYPNSHYVDVRFFNLVQANYDEGPPAIYAYSTPAPVNPGNPQSLAAGNVVTCTDTRYAGAMSKIRYEYVPAGHSICGSSAWGQIKAERNLTTNVLVSSVTYPAPPCYFDDAPWRTETRGDGATREFHYSLGGELESYTDFAFTGETHHSTTIGITMSPGNNTHYLRTVTPDALPSHFTTTEMELKIGALMAVIHPNGSKTEYFYTDPNNPHHVAWQKDENNQITYYDRRGANELLHPNRVWRIRYPDGGSEEFTYNNFGQVLWHRMTSGGEEEFTYDNRGLKQTYKPPWTESDPDRHGTHYFYYPSGKDTDRLYYVEDSLLRSTWFEYNLRGQVTKVRYQNQTFIQNFYNDDGTLERTIDELQHVTRYVNDEYKRITHVIKVVDNIDEVTTNDYRPLSGGPNDEFTHTTSSVYRTTSPMQKETQFGYDANFRRRWMAVAPGTDDVATTNYTYDPVGNLTRVEDPRHRFTTYGYDERNRQTSIWNEELDETTTMLFDGVGNKKRETREDGAFRTWDYDEMNRLWKAYDWRMGDPAAPNQTTTYDRDDAGNVLFITDTKTAVYSFLYDALNRKKSATNPSDNTVPARTETWLYDFAGNLLRYKNPSDQFRHFEYDDRNRQRRSYWNLLPNPNTAANWSVGQEIITTPDAASRVTEIKTNGGETIVAFGYDEANRKKWEDQTLFPLPTRRVKSDLDHDGKRINLQIVEPPMEGGGLISSPEMSGSGSYAIAYGYTERGQLEQINGTGEENWTFSYVYDPSGNMVSRRADYNDRTSWTKCPNNGADEGYDALNRPKRWEQTGPNGFYALSHYRYDNVNREEATWRAENNNRGERYEYEITNQLKKVTYNINISPTPAPPTPTPPNATPTPPPGTPTPPPPPGRVLPILITVDGEPGQEVMHVTMHTDTAGATIFYRMSPDNFFDPAHVGPTGIPPTATYYNPLSVPVGQVQYFRAVAYKDGMIDSVMNEMMVENIDGGGDTPTALRVVTYAHTPDMLNRSSMNDAGVVTGYAPNALNQYTSTAGSSFSYDNNFNMTHTTGFYGVYDAANRLVSASNGGSGEAGQTTASFVYDGLGRCVKRTVGNIATVFIYDGWKPIGEFDQWGYFQAWNVYGPGADEILLRQQDKMGYTRFLLDRHGNVAFLVDNDGVIKEKYSFDVFGQPKITDASGNVRAFSYYSHAFLFQGREYIRQLGIYDYRNRFYHPGLGRFIQTDPLGLQTEGARLSAQQAALYAGEDAPETFSYSELNLYRYCENDPVNRSDPFGLDFFPYTGAPIPVDTIKGGAGMGQTLVDPSVVLDPQGDGTFKLRLDVRITGILVAQRVNFHSKTKLTNRSTEEKRATFEEHEKREHGKDWSGFHEKHKGEVPSTRYNDRDAAEKAAKGLTEKVKSEAWKANKTFEEHQPEDRWKNIRDREKPH